LPRNLCPLIKSSFGSVIDQKCSKTRSCPHFGLVDLIVAEATCDGKKKMYELLDKYIPTYVMDLPQKPENQNALEYYIKELESLKDVLEKLTGNKISDTRLRNEIKSANETRRLLHAIYELRKKRLTANQGNRDVKGSSANAFSGSRRVHKNLVLLLDELKVKKRENSGPRIMISGCPMAAGNMKVPEIIEERAGWIVVEESCTGTRAFWDLVDENKEPMRALAERYLKIPVPACPLTTGGSPDPSILPGISMLMGSFIIPSRSAMDTMSRNTGLGKL